MVATVAWGATLALAGGVVAPVVAAAALRSRPVTRSASAAAAKAASADAEREEPATSGTPRRGGARGPGKRQARGGKQDGDVARTLLLVVVCLCALTAFLSYPVFLLPPRAVLKMKVAKLLRGVTGNARCSVAQVDPVDPEVDLLLGSPSAYGPVGSPDWYGGDAEGLAKFPKVSTRSALAEQLFMQGMVHAYGFNRVEARRNFKVTSLLSFPLSLSSSLSLSLASSPSHT